MLLPRGNGDCPGGCAGLPCGERQSGPQPAPRGGHKAPDVDPPPSARADLAPESSERVVATRTDPAASGQAFQNKSPADPAHFFKTVKNRAQRGESLHWNNA